MTDTVPLAAMTRRFAWLALIGVALATWFLPDLVVLFAHSTLLFSALRIAMPFAALPFVLKLWPKHPKRAFAIYFTIVNFTFLLALSFGALWAAGCALHNGPCH